MGRLLRLYFDLVYNPLYDLTTARLSRYRTLQRKCLHALALSEARNLLCVGLGTGNELERILLSSDGLRVTGIDLSTSALSRSARKARACRKAVELHAMDASALLFPDGTFDRVLCVHVLDFLARPERAVREMIRVLSPGGRFVITFPSRREGAKLGASLASDEVRESLRAGRHPLAVVADLLFTFSVGLVYVPLLARAGRRAFSEGEVQAMFRDLPARLVAVEEEEAYQDLVVIGMKT